MGPNDRINLALIGCGARGGSVASNFRDLPGVRIIALCDVNSKRLAEKRGQFGGARVAAYRDFREVMDNKDVDAVIVATQAHWHVLPTIAACQAGKDVYVEKPLGNSIGEGRFAVKAARKYNRIVQIGTQQRSWEHYHRAVEIIQSGVLGEISEVQVWDLENRCPGRGNPPDCDPPTELDWDFYVGPAPAVRYNPNHYYNYGYDWFSFSGSGHQLAWGVHHFDIVHWAMGVKWPTSASAMGGMFAFQDNRDWPESFSGICTYGPGPVARKGFLLQYTLRMGARRQQRSHGKCFFGTKGSMLVSRGGYWITPERGVKDAPREDHFVTEEDDSHQKVFLQRMRDRWRSLADVEEGHYSSTPGHLMNISWLVGRPIRWDGEKEQVVGDDEANALVTKPYRAPWKLEV